MGRSLKSHLGRIAPLALRATCVTGATARGGGCQGPKCGSAAMPATRRLCTATPAPPAIVHWALRGDACAPAPSLTGSPAMRRSHRSARGGTGTG